MRQALELALQFIESNADSDSERELVATIKEALAQPEQEPVAWLNKEKNTIIWDKIYPDMQPLYTTPPQRTWVGLTDDEIFEIHKQVDSMQYLTFGHAIEQRLKEKNF